MYGNTFLIQKHAYTTLKCLKKIYKTASIYSKIPFLKITIYIDVACYKIS